MNKDNKYILLVDDNEDIHIDFHKVLDSTSSPLKDSETLALEALLFNTEPSTVTPTETITYQIDDAYQGEEALAMVDKAASENWQYSLIFMDVRMPPGMDGIMTIHRIWQKYPDIEMVICTAYSDYSWDEILSRFGNTDHLLFMKKPFDAVAVKQTALSLTTKWALNQTNRAHMQELENEVAKRTHELEQMVEHLNRLKEKAEEATLLKSNFLSTMSHEIRTPLQGIMGMTDLLLDTDLSEEQLEYSTTIKSASDTLLTIVNDILDYSKLEAGKVVLEHIDFDIRTCVESVTELMSIKAFEKELEIGLFFHADVPDMVNGDPERLRQILLNIVGNAIKFTEKGSISIEVNIEQSLPEGSEPTGLVAVRFEITDTGIGIKEEKTRNLFKRFSQADTTMTRKYGGTGLGLAISKRLCELMSGTIGLISEFEKGSTFWFSIPFRQSSYPPVETVPLSANLKGFRILIISSSAICKRVLKLYLEYWQAECLCFLDVDHALEMVGDPLQTAQIFDSVLIDLGNAETAKYYEAAQRLTGHPSLNTTPLICIMSHRNRGDSKKLLDSGFIGYLIKPIKQKHLFNCIQLVKEHSNLPPTYKDTPITKDVVEELVKNTPRLLVAEDTPVNQRLIARILERAGIKCDMAINGIDAVKAASVRKYDMILMDVHMPECNGLEATRQIRAANGVNNKTPIIALTASVLADDANACHNAGMDDIIYKPFTKDNIYAIIKKYLDKDA